MITNRIGTAIALRIACLIWGGILPLVVPFASAEAQDIPPEPLPGTTPAESVGLPKYSDMPLPEAEELLRSRPFDWIVLKNQDVVIAEPISLRPDPILRAQVKLELAQRNYNRLMKHKSYRDAEILSQRQFVKDPDRAAELDERDAEIKAELGALRDRIESLKPNTFKMRITLKDVTEDSEFLLEMRHVDSVVFYEDLLLRRAEKLIEAGNVPLAYDLLLVVTRRFRENNASIRAELEAEETELSSTIKRLDDERTALRQTRDELNRPINKNNTPAKTRSATIEKTIAGIIVELKDLDEDLRNVRVKLRSVRPKDFPNPEPARKDDVLLASWPKFDDVYQRLIFKDSDRHLERGDLEGAWRLLAESWKPGVENAALSARLGAVCERLIQPCLDRRDYRRGRYHLREMAQLIPTHPVATAYRDKFVELASTAVAEARDASQRGDAAEGSAKIELASRIWPELPGLKEIHRELTERYQVLRVGVLHLPGESSADRLPTEADDRVRMLAESRMFEPIGFNDQAARYTSAYMESWEPTDLGRQVKFQLKLRRSDWESRPLISSADIQTQIAAKLQPDNPSFDERFAGFVEGISVQSPSEFTVRFRQLPLRLDAAWQFTVAAGDASRSFNDDALNPNDPNFGRERFHRYAGDGDRLKLTRVRSQPQSTRQRRVEEVIEIRYETWQKSLQGLLRGDVDLLPYVDHVDLKGLQEDGRFSVIPYGLPRTHLLMFNPRSTPLSDGQLRRALSHGISREQYLNEIFLKDARSSVGRLVTCPFATTSYAYNRQLAQPAYEPSLAATLALTARKRLGGQIPPLTMICPNDSRARDATLAMIENWKRIGVEVRLSDDAASDSGWDICYRTTKSIEPLMDAWPLLTMNSTARIDALQNVPESTRRLLLELERSVDWTTATKLLQRLDAELLSDARYIPLWEIDEFQVARRNVVGLPGKLVHPYHDIERWTVQPWYPQDIQ